VELTLDLSEEDVAILDACVRDAGLPSRSPAVRHAVRLLHQPDGEDDHTAAWAEWRTSGQEAEWENTTPDGLDDTLRLHPQL
jgi:Arc/MetJ-type ribon-helix-helix transcriptional regulator